MDGRDEWSYIKPAFLQNIVFDMQANEGSYKVQEFE
jgi:hypothetical protein